MAEKKIRVLFVCLGNICRSPMAEAVFSRMVEQEGLSDRILVDSAGTSGYHVGEKAHRGTRQILKEHGISYVGQSRQLKMSDLKKSDYLIAMDESNLNNIHSLGDTSAFVGRLLDFATKSQTKDVPDPYYTGGFDYVYQLVEDGSRGLLQHIQQEHNL